MEEVPKIQKFTSYAVPVTDVSGVLGGKVRADSLLGVPGEKAEVAAQA